MFNCTVNVQSNVSHVELQARFLFSTMELDWWANPRPPKRSIAASKLLVPISPPSSLITSNSSSALFSLETERYYLTVQVSLSPAVASKGDVKRCYAYLEAE
jgi:hypothetical protein